MDPSEAITAVAVFSALIAVIPAIVLEGRRQRAAQSAGVVQRPYAWGYFQGVAAVVFGTVVLCLLFAAGGDAILGGLAFFTAYAVPGFFVVKRRRWAWVVLTIASLNPILWIAHYFYARNRWAELRHERAGSTHAADFGHDPRAPTGVVGRFRQRLVSWHPGKIALLWGIAVVLLLMLLSLYEDEEGTALALWMVLVGPLFYVTWVWFGSRER